MRAARALVGVLAPMKCPECEKAGLTSRFNEFKEPAGYQTLEVKPAVERFFDEDGKRHVHDQTDYKIMLVCTNKHAFRQIFQSRCPCKGCAWNERPEVKAGDKKIGEG